MQSVTKWLPESATRAVYIPVVSDARSAAAIRQRPAKLSTNAAATLATVATLSDGNAKTNEPEDACTVRCTSGLITNSTIGRIPSAPPKPPTIAHRRLASPATRPASPSTTHCGGGATSRSSSTRSRRGESNQTS